MQALVLAAHRFGAPQLMIVKAIAQPNVYGLTP
jgi:hypothetical protein